ncbi:hypothetical protein DPMN_017579, partial [Dreissena polymorpha]
IGEDWMKFSGQTDRQTDRQSDSYIALITSNGDINILDIPNFENKLIQFRRMEESTRHKRINILTKFHKDWMKTATSIVNTSNLINILTKFHKDKMKTVTSTVYTNKLLTINILTKFHKDWMKTETSTINILTKFHKDWMKTATSIVHTSELINILTKFHKHWIKTVTSTVYTNKLLMIFQLFDVMTQIQSQPIFHQKNILTKFHKDWMKTATSIVYTRFFYSSTYYNNPNPDFIKINILTKFHKDWMKTVTSTVYTNKLLTDARTHARTYGRRTSHGYISSPCHFLSKKDQRCKRVQNMRERGKHIPQRNALPPGGHIFQPTRTILELFIGTNLLTKLIMMIGQ